MTAAASIKEFTAGLDAEIFGGVESLYSAVLFKLMIIGEAVSRLSEELKGKCSNIDWRSIAGFRNIIVHAYFRLSLPLVWEAATIRVPELSRDVQKIIDDIKSFQISS